MPVWIKNLRWPRTERGINHSYIIICYVKIKQNEDGGDYHYIAEIHSYYWGEFHSMVINGLGIQTFANGGLFVSKSMT